MSMQSPMRMSPALPHATLTAPGFTTQFQANPAGFSLSNTLTPMPATFAAPQGFLPMSVPMSVPMNAPMASMTPWACRPPLPPAGGDMNLILAFLHGMAFGPGSPRHQA